MNPLEIPPMGCQFQEGRMAKKTKCQQVETHLEKIRELRTAGWTWRQISVYLNEKHHIGIEFSYLRRIYEDLVPVVPVDVAAQATQQRVNFLQTRQPINASKLAHLNRLEEQCKKKEALLKRAQKQRKVWQAKCQKLIEVIEKNRQQVGEVVYEAFMKCAVEQGEEA
jgi:ribosomal protein L24